MGKILLISSEAATSLYIKRQLGGREEIVEIYPHEIAEAFREKQYDSVVIDIPTRKIDEYLGVLKTLREHFLAPTIVITDVHGMEEKIQKEIAPVAVFVKPVDAQMIVSLVEGVKTENNNNKK